MAEDLLFAFTFAVAFFCPPEEPDVSEVESGICFSLLNPVPPKEHPWD